MANEFKTQEEMIGELELASNIVVVGGYYAHYKNPGKRDYQVVGLAIYEETEQVCVVHKALKMKTNWIRTLENFLDEVDYEGKKMKRFTLLS